MSIGAALLRQCSHPTGWFGRLLLRNMNRSHDRLTDWGLKHVSIEPHHTILDVGCGGGRTIGKLAALSTRGKTYGVDYSEESVGASVRANRAAIQQGRVRIVRASVSRLPFTDNAFDVVTAVETHYFWPDLNADFREVRRVLKPGGGFVLIAEAYIGGRHDALVRRLRALQQRGIRFAHLTVGEHRDLLSTAGYERVDVFEQGESGWLCAIARR